MIRTLFKFALAAFCLFSESFLAECSVTTRSGQFQFVGNEGMPGLTIASGAPIEIDTARDTGLEISNLKVNVTPNQIDGASFTIKNLGTRDLIAYSVVLNTFWDSAPTKPMQLRVTVDGWFMRQYVLHPGESGPGTITAGLTPTTPMKLIKVTVTPDYAEYADGRVVGASAGVFAEQFAASRRRKESVRQAYASLLKEGKDIASVRAMLQSGNPQVKVTDDSGLVALSVLRTIATREGDAALLKALQDEPAERLMPDVRHQ